MSKTHISLLFFSPGFWELWQSEKIQATELTSGPSLQQTGMDGQTRPKLPSTRSRLIWPVRAGQSQGPDMLRATLTSPVPSLSGFLSLILSHPSL